jgi:hypothetical protein
MGCKIMHAASLGLAPQALCWRPQRGLRPCYQKTEAAAQSAAARSIRPQLTPIAQKILHSYLFLFHVKYQRLDVLFQGQLKLLGFLNFGERQRPQLLLNAPPVVRHQ